MARNGSTVVGVGVILQRDLSRYVRLEAARAAASKALRAAEEERDAVGDAVFEMLEAGARVEPGKLVAGIEDGRRYPRWKEEFITRHGEAEAEKVLAATKPTRVLKVETV